MIIIIEIIEALCCIFCGKLTSVFFYSTGGSGLHEHPELHILHSIVIDYYFTTSQSPLTS